MSPHKLTELSNPPPEFDPRQYPIIALQFFGLVAPPVTNNAGAGEIEAIDIDEAA